MKFIFDQFTLDTDIAELRRGTAAVALDHTLPHPHPPDVPRVDAGSGALAAGLGTRGEDVPDVPGDGRSGVDWPTLTRSVLFLTVGVPARDKGRSMCVVVIRGGSELF